MIAPTVAVFFGILALTVGIGGEEPQDRNPVGGLAFRDEVEVTVVNIEVYVRDKEGRPVTGLTMDDFEVFQDGRPRRLTNFLFVDESFRPTTQEAALMAPTPVVAGEASKAAAEKAGSARAVVKPIHIVVYIDNENLRPFGRNRVLGHVRRFLSDTVRPGVEAMIVSYQGSAEIVQPFTSDARALAEAMRTLRKCTGGRVNRDAEHAAIVREIDRMRIEEANRRGDNPLTQKAAMAYDQLVAYADAVTAETIRDTNAISRLSSTLTGLPGRKYLIYVSSGLPMVPAKDLFYEFSQHYRIVSFNSMMVRYNQRREYRSLAAAANAQGVTFYTIDAQGLAPNAAISSERAVVGDPSAGVIAKMNYEEPLIYIAERTGGLATVGTNDFATGLGLVRQDIFTYYSLGYPITAAGGDRVQSIEVRLPGHPKLKLRYRKTFVEKSRESQVQDAVMAALLFDVDDNSMGINVTVGEPEPAREDRWQLPVRVAFPTRSVALLPQGENLVGEVVVFVSLRDAEGKQADLRRREQAIHLPRAEYERLAGLELSVDFRLLVKEGRYRIAVGLLDRVTRQASYQVLSASTPGG
ncbi:MAG: VWA domain-containing protein [Thermoanaerobaculales bacterium]